MSWQTLHTYALAPGVSLGSSNTAVLNLWVVTPPTKGWMPLSQKLPKTIEKQLFTLWFTTVAKLQSWTNNKNNFMIGDHHNMRNYVKGSQWSKESCKYCSSRRVKQDRLGSGNRGNRIMEQRRYEDAVPAQFSQWQGCWKIEMGS